MYLSTMLYDCNKYTAFICYLSLRKRLDCLQYLFVIIYKTLQRTLARKKGFSLDVHDTNSSTSTLTPYFYMKLDPNTNCLPLKDYLESASSNIKEKLYLGTPQELCVNIPYSSVSQTMVPGNHRPKAPPHLSRESTYFSHPIIAVI